MKLRYALLVFLFFGFTACENIQELLDETEKLLGGSVEIMDGTYESECMEDESDGAKSQIVFSTISNGKRQISYQIFNYENDLDCSEASTSQGEITIETIVLAENGFGGNISYFKEGGNQGSVVAYYVDDIAKAIYIPKLEGSSGEGPEELKEYFSNFIQNPRSGIKYTRQ